MEQATGFGGASAKAHHFVLSGDLHEWPRSTVTVSPAEAPVPPHPAEVVVPYWTDDAGYCKPIPGFEHHVHRPSGLTPITLLQGQKLVFKYSIHHDVWAHPSREALEACDYTSAILLAGRMDGGGCEDDADLGCIESSKGFKLAPTQDELYLSCSIHDHCRNGQRLVVRMLSVVRREQQHLRGAVCRAATPCRRGPPTATWSQFPAPAAADAHPTLDANTAQHMSSSSEQTAHGV